MIMTISALTKSLSEYVSCRPRWRLAGGGGVGICSTSQSMLTRILPGVSISVPPKYEVWSLKYFRGSRAQVNPSARLYIDFRSFRFMTTSDLIIVTAVRCLLAQLRLLFRRRGRGLDTARR